MSQQPGSVCPRCFQPLGGDRYCRYCGYDSYSIPNIKSVSLPLFSRIGGRYVLGAVLGAGGFGVTYAALDTANGCRVAVKEYYPLDLAERDSASGYLSSRKNPTEFEAGLTRFAEEAEALRALTRSPYIVYFTDLVRENGTAYLVMEFIEGKNLRDYAKQQGGRLPFHTAYNCLTNIALALADVHTRGILHRDISPENILLQNDGECKLIDFGAARTSSHKAASNTVFLKPGYAPPEQYQVAGNQGPWTDVYALACTFYRLVTGMPVPDAQQRVNGAPVPAIHTLVNHVPLHVSLAIEKAMNLRESDRFPNMHAFIGEIIAYNEDHSTKKSTMGRTGSMTSRFLDFFYELGNKQQNPEVTIVGGPYAGSSITLTDGIPLLIGRLSPTCGLIAGSDPRISRIHCKLTYYKSAGYVVLEDTSSNGTYLPESGYRMYQGETLRLEYTTLLQLATSDSIIKVVMK